MEKKRVAHQGVQEKLLGGCLVSCMAAHGAGCALHGRAACGGLPLQLHANLVGTTHLREGVTAASATRGLAIMAPTPLITPAVMAAAARSCFWALWGGEQGRMCGIQISRGVSTQKHAPRRAC